MAALTLSAGVVGALLTQSAIAFQLDLSVFRDAGAAFIGNQPLYSEGFPTSSGFRFIYPPFAAALFAPMGAISATALQIGWTLLNIVLVWWVLRICLSRLNIARPSSVALLVLGPALLLEPVRANFAFGQVNIVLMALVMTDFLGAVPRWLRGTLTGLAAAIKLTPAGFALLMLVRRDYRAVVMSTAMLLSTIGIGFWLLPEDSTWFWVIEFFRDERAGGHDFHRNQAITGPLTRLGMDGALKDAVWLCAALLVAVGAFWSARRLTRNGEHVAAVGVVALAVLLAAPFAVTHHWVYCVVLIPLLLAPQYRSWRPVLLTTTVAFLIGPHVLLEGRLPSNDWQAAVITVLAYAQFLTAATLFVAAVVVAKRRPEASRQVAVTSEPSEQLVMSAQGR